MRRRRSICASSVARSCTPPSSGSAPGSSAPRSSSASRSCSGCCSRTSAATSPLRAARRDASFAAASRPSLPLVPAAPHARRRRARLGPGDHARARDARRRRRRDDRRLPPRRRRHPPARHLDQGGGVDPHARRRRRGRPRRADHADRRRARLDASAAGSRVSDARAAHPDRRRRRRRHGRGLPHAARRRAARRRGALSRRLRVGRAHPGRPRQRHRLLGRHLDLRRVDAVRARAALSVRARAPAALRPCSPILIALVAAPFSRSCASCEQLSQEAAGAGVGAAGRRRPGARARSPCRRCFIFGSATPASPGRASASSAAATARRSWPSPARRGCRGGWSARSQLLLILGVVKLLAASLTIGSGGSAGDFAPSLVAGRASSAAPSATRSSSSAPIRASIPGAFALVGMGTLLRRHRARAAVARWCSCASWPAATTCSCR